MSIDEDNDGFITKSEIANSNNQWKTSLLELNDDNLFKHERISYA